MKINKSQKVAPTHPPIATTPPSGHEYMKVLTGNFAPTRGSAAGWIAAKPIAQRILLEDFAKDPDRSDYKSHGARISVLCLYLTWLADTSPTHLLDDPMDHDEIRRYLATEGIIRRSSHRSRVALQSILKSFGSNQVAKIVHTDFSTIPPTDNLLFEKALRAVGFFRNPETRANARSLLLLSRSTGVNGHELRFITGNDVIRISGAGTWVIVRAPGAERTIPVLKRFQQELEDLALSAGDKPMISRNGTIPIDSSRPGELAGVISRELKRSKTPGLIQVNGLRKAWLAEHVASNAPILTLLKAAGLKSLRSIDDLVGEFAPLPTTNPVHLSYELGGTE